MTQLRRGRRAKQHENQDALTRWFSRRLDELGYSQLELAKRMGNRNYQSLISRWLRGDQKLSQVQRTTWLLIVGVIGEPPKGIEDEPRND